MNWHPCKGLRPPKADTFPSRNSLCWRTSGVWTFNDYLEETGSSSGLAHRAFCYPESDTYTLSLSITWTRLGGTTGFGEFGVFRYTRGSGGAGTSYAVIRDARLSSPNLTFITPSGFSTGTYTPSSSHRLLVELARAGGDVTATFKIDGTTVGTDTFAWSAFSGPGKSHEVGVNHTFAGGGLGDEWRWTDLDLAIA